MNVLIVEDELSVAKSIKKTILSCPSVNIAEVVNNSDDAILKINSNVFDFILLDILLEKDSLTGLDLCKYIRKKNKRIPIVIVTGFHSTDRLEQAFKFGANDYIKKPFDPRELQLRVERWSQLSSKVFTENSIEYNGLSYHFLDNEFYFMDKVLDISRRNKVLLRLLIEKPEQLLRKDYIEEKFWGDYDGTRNHNVRSNIQSLRRSLEPFCDDWIRTIRGEGYMIKKTIKKVLILEDEVVLSRLYKKNLEQAGFEVECVEDVDLAVEILDKFHPDLTLIDYGIRGKDKTGLWFVPFLKEKCPDCRVVMLSNYSHSELRKEAIDAGAEDFLVKLNISPKDLPDYVKRLFV